MAKITEFPASAKFMHWLSALLIISMLFLGVSMIQSLATWQHTALQLHKSIGALVLVLVLIRLINRLFMQIPALPADLSAMQRFAAKASHIVLYALMLAIPLSGWLMQNAAGLTVSPFGILNLPSLIPANIKAYAVFRELHGLLTWSLFAVIVLHISAALHHGLIRQDSVLQSMLFRFKNK
ncbi:cytochrome b [Rheinheimera metallidurans]|uniref:cytochrome b n=1 Tax=Rheinheimera metallidurans TaxID=2925781 RepID=UPI003003168F